MIIYQKLIEKHHINNSLKKNDWFDILVNEIVI